MESNNKISYDINKSSDRIDEILNASNSNYSDKNYIPARSTLTYNNGYYVHVTALFIDIVGSSDMTNDHLRPTLAKIYRSFISECVAIMNEQEICKEINIHGDCVWGVFETPKKTDIDTVINVSAKLYSMIKILNYKLKKKEYNEIDVGIGIDYGRALMVQAGYSGSSINEVIWMGDVVNSACHLANKAGRSGREVVIFPYVIYNNINEHNKGLFTQYYDMDECKTLYEGTIVNTGMEEWYEENCK